MYILVLIEISISKGLLMKAIDHAQSLLLSTKKK